MTMNAIHDPVLAYAAFGLQSSPAEYVKQVIMDFYTAEELIAARDALSLAVCDDL